LSTDLTEPSSSIVRQSKPEDGLWLIAIVFGYVFGLFLIFVIVWFIWYGTSLKRKYISSSAKPLPVSNSGETSPRCHYEYSASSSLNWPISNSFGINHDANTTLTGLRRNNPVFGSINNDDILSNSQFRIINYEANSQNNQYSPDHTNSFVQMYHKQRV